MKEAPEKSEKSIFSRRLMHTRLATRAAVILERVWPLILPLLVVAGLFASLSWFGVFRLMPDAARLALVAAFGLAALASLYPLRFYRAPRPEEIDRRIEAANALVHTPLQAQTDRPVGKDDGFALALWREHQKRMAETLADVGGALPRTGVPERDPWALRAVVALLLVTAFAYSFGQRGGSLEDGFRAAALAETVPPRIDAWVTPPAYTGRAPIFLTAENNASAPVFTVPEGSDVTLRITGGSGEESVVFTGRDGTARDIAQADVAQPSPAPAENAPALPRQFAGKLTADGVLALRAGEKEMDSWAFAVVADKPPVIRFADEPKRAANGAFELRYEIEDDYGAASAKADFALEDAPPPDARPLYGPPEMPLSVPRRGSGGIAMKATRDLTEHVWAGSRTKLTLSAVDDAGQEAKTETKTIELPQRPFTNPLARAVVELRKVLSLDANQKRRVVDLIDAITLRPEDTFDNPTHYLGLMAGRTRLNLASTDDQLRDVADYLWNMALQIEDGGLTDAEKRLRQAQEALKQALRDGASDEEIDRLMKELRQAMNEFLREFAERAARDPNLAQQEFQPGQELSQSDLERMMDQIENLAKSGNRQQAEELLSQLQDMMNNLQARRQQQPGEGGQESEMRQQMNKLGEIMRRQQETMNETFRMDQMQRGQQQRGQDRGQQRGQEGEQGEGQQRGQGQGMTPEEFAEALKQLQQGQGQLQKDLEALMKGLEGMGIQPGEGFGEAGEAMGEAEGALGDGDGGRATGEQGRALEALRRGAQDMMQQMQNAMQGDQGGGEEGGRQQNADRDPLGRPRATTGPDFGESVKIPDEIDVQRARQILEAIRKRLGNALSPELERSYLERLLKLD
ncbi:TIGR02302 family protein [Mesorhizobium sp. LHD-90]|uniref:TIGR02302 family protein n=1 Tax=Mesorhizobium sp. LHD-90 TaxID=3071414 RepID=UPI0027E08BE5|nr:TIGR02302 family protein [Mesorhizobium sp. LHD-90]MDQ6432664.1 TIGR02302 family protein [Mesorhizobium sp. LHD-90]